MWLVINNVCMYFAIGFTSISRQRLKIKLIIFIGEKTSLSIVAPLDYMNRYSRHDDSRTSWHSRDVRMIVEVSPFSLLFSLLFSSF